ncbi:MAG: hypothetical protein O7E52_21900, partial [Candidatus Poribacteria bacterium]|nr:hypothetical protein [Candidatus Poribacteria bacterium]
SPSFPSGESRPDRKNDIAETFAEQIDESFGEYILPGVFNSAFNPEDAELYVQQRTWVAGGRKPGGDFAYEQYLHQNFYPPAASDYPLLIVVGGEGTGKSTLLRYYFDCYLPNFNQFKRDEDKVDKRLLEECLSRLLTLYVNLRREPSREAVERKIFGTFRAQIQKRFKEISTENDYAMWERRAHWEEAHHADGEQNFPNRNAYRRDYVREFIGNDSIFVEEAFWYLGRQRDSEGKRKYYISLILDDLDQQFRDIQLYVINVMLAWLSDRAYHLSPMPGDEQSYIDLWKVILPLRPETLRSLGAPLHPVEKKLTLELGGVAQTPLLERRTQKLKSEIKSSGLQVESDHFIEDDDTLVYVPLPP